MQLQEVRAVWYYVVPFFVPFYTFYYKALTWVKYIFCSRWSEALIK